MHRKFLFSRLNEVSFVEDFEIDWSYRNAKRTAEAVLFYYYHTI